MSEIHQEYQRLRIAVAEMILRNQWGDEHFFDVSMDGDGWNEPFTDHYGCACGYEIGNWLQSDPECTGRPDPVDMLLKWHDHLRKEPGEMDLPSGNDCYRNALGFMVHEPGCICPGEP